MVVSAIISVTAEYLHKCSFRIIVNRQTQYKLNRCSTKFIKEHNIRRKCNFTCILYQTNVYRMWIEWVSTVLVHSAYFDNIQLRIKCAACSNVNILQRVHILQAIQSPFSSTLTEMLSYSSRELSLVRAFGTHENFNIRLS